MISDGKREAVSLKTFAREIGLGVTQNVTDVAQWAYRGGSRKRFVP